MDVNKFYHFDTASRMRGCPLSSPFEFSLNELFGNNDALINLIYSLDEEGRVVSDLDLHLSHKGMSQEMLNVLHSIQKENPYIFGLPSSPGSVSDVDDFLFQTMISRYDQFGAYAQENQRRITDVLKSSRDDVKPDEIPQGSSTINND